ncbi:hypothetical protein M427DRAFT_39833 [Gonapodya prolifera JEL478]|uniref:Uncharacterized protein n=1 Tax=Gonapodya prolifera (strain JEL478) TaxID=1344416 RepID=A0A138ZWM8_GONPJ|nr:hypothetical protein M427DRAFT_39833 [Gonapodya prolifera JEL478]|eukprot:KXS08909.1 hypothetical protein M427DRAFT_39833 [Gonapodya prolifera JEL478]
MSGQYDLLLGFNDPDDTDSLLVEGGWDHNDNKTAMDNEAGAPAAKKRKKQFHFDKDGGHDLPLAHAVLRTRTWEVGRNARHETVPAAWEATIEVATALPLPRQKEGKVWVQLTWDGLVYSTAHQHYKTLITDYKGRQAASQKESGVDEPEVDELDKVLCDCVRLENDFLKMKAAAKEEDAAKKLQEEGDAIVARDDAMRCLSDKSSKRLSRASLSEDGDDDFKGDVDDMASNASNSKRSSKKGSTAATAIAELGKSYKATNQASMSQMREVVDAIAATSTSQAASLKIQEARLRHEERKLELDREKWEFDKDERQEEREERRKEREDRDKWERERQERQDRRDNEEKAQRRAMDERMMLLMEKLAGPK